MTSPLLRLPRVQRARLGFPYTSAPFTPELTIALWSGNKQPLDATESAMVDYAWNLTRRDLREEP